MVSFEGVSHVSPVTCGTKVEVTGQICEAGVEVACDQLSPGGGQTLDWHRAWHHRWYSDSRYVEERITSMSSMISVPTWLSLAENICKVAVWHELVWWKWLGRKSRTWRVTRKCKNIIDQRRNFAAPTRIQQTKTCINIKGKPSIKYSFKKRLPYSLLLVISKI